LILRELASLANFEVKLNIRWPLLFVMLISGSLRAFPTNDSTSLVVVAIRYVKAYGISHAHLYLYEENGKFLRQLTNFKTGQDHNPLFSDDGTLIVFTRTSDTDGGKNVVYAKSNTPSEVEYWQVGVDGKKLQRLPIAPEWYKNSKDAAYFTTEVPTGWPKDQLLPGEPNEQVQQDGDSSVADLKKLPVSKFISQDGNYELVLKLAEDDLNSDGPGNGKLYELRNLKTGKRYQLGSLPNYLGLYDLLHSSEDPHNLFLIDGNLRLVFFQIHLNSTDGDTVYALDLKKPQLVRLSDNYSTPIPIPEEPAFLAWTDQRYVPIPYSKKTANCSYLAHWDANLQEIDYFNPNTAPNCYGASLYREGKKPSVLKMSENIY